VLNNEIIAAHKTVFLDILILLSRKFQRYYNDGHVSIPDRFCSRYHFENPLNVSLFYRKAAYKRIFSG